MGNYNFDVVLDRKNTDCIKWDFGMQRKGRSDLLPLWVADMDFKLPDEILKDISDRVAHGIFGYTDPGDKYRNIVKDWYEKRHGFTIDGNDIIVTPGVVYAIAIAIRAFTKPGDAVIIQQPVYYPFQETIRLNDRKVVNNQLVYKNGRYEIDFDDFEKKVVDNDVKLFLLCSPHNPVGRVWTRQELTRLGEICARHDVYVFADEIHSDFVYPGHKHNSFITLDEKYTKKLILGTSASKTFNLAGLQVANIILKDKDMFSSFARENEAAGYSQPNALGMVATMSVYQKGEEWLDELIEYLQGNLAFVRDFLNEKLSKIRLIEPEGTYLIWLDFSAIADSHKELEKLIVDGARLWLDPGIIFGKETSLFERINIACPRSILKQAMEQLYEAISNADSKI
ncbi:MAG: pyridoxal phosphate-dependent aminotransferase [Butyrivibrio sp.]|nr:MalY/PatB family protein [Butyrivibrio sp.]MBQ8030898.1 pyridoxal phosphate-dependent aminotransferase [Butyrivibrio sp.]MBR1643597.1 pyridoxal phosphate-dependent aminotransferase [Butyrivibrio sp.]